MSATSNSEQFSDDLTWDVGDKLIGRVSQNRTLNVGATYTAGLTGVVPGALPGDYHIIVRNDIYDVVPEGSGESNNETVAADALTISLNTLELGVPSLGMLSHNQRHYYQLDAGPDHTVQIKLDSLSLSASNEIYVRYGDVPDLVHAPDPRTITASRGHGRLGKRSGGSPPNLGPARAATFAQARTIQEQRPDWPDTADR